MIVYDFDKTIYTGDSTLDFYFYCLKKNPKLVIYVPAQIVGFLMFLFGKYNKEQFKSAFYSFLKGIKNIDENVNNFWKVNKVKISKWYVNQKCDSDVIISASPEFLLKPVCCELRVNCLIASNVNKTNGKYCGKNCYGQEKVKRFYCNFPNGVIDEFYSDSLSDNYLAEIAAKSYIVSNNKIVKWENYKPTLFSKIKEVFFKKDFLLFLFVGVINTINGIAFAYLYSLFFNSNLAFSLGYVTSLSISYILNSFITFKEQLSFDKYLKFCISYIPNFIIQNIIVIIFLNIMGWYKLFVYALAAVIGVPITFLLMKFYAFKKNNDV